MAQNYLICDSVNRDVELNKLDESAGEKYILTGCFATLDEKNRNSRIYTEDEYLKHLQYLRHDIENGEPLLGELDHPEDRFEVKLKDASHKVTNLWYDKPTKTIMGTIELLDTPNGRIAKSLVDEGVPLHISSRAAGSVDPNSNVVHLDQIYTYDLVAKPGFASAVLHRVNESDSAQTYGAEVMEFLRESENSESRNLASYFGMSGDEVNIRAVSYEPRLRKEAVAMKESEENKANDTNNDMNTNEQDKILVESEENAETNVAECDATKQNECGVTEATEQDGEDKEQKDDASTESDTDGKDSEEKKEDDKSEDEKPEDDGVEIIDVRIAPAEDEKSDEEEKESEESKDDEKSEDGEKDGEKSEEGEKEAEATDECNTVECNSTAADDKQEQKVTDSNKLNDSAKKDIEKRKDDFLKTIQDLTAAIEKKSKSDEEKKNESVTMAQYPVSMMLDEGNFARFHSLSESQKRKVSEYLMSNKITDRAAINEHWSEGLNASETPVWIKYAPENYRKLYESAPENVKASLKTTAEYVVFENQRDINVFWENSGLAEREERRMINESFISNIPVITHDETPQMPYSNDIIKQVANMACEYNG